ncbi:MAG: glycosyltransferase family protein, partial [Acidimicrobiales bacterium]
MRPTFHVFVSRRGNIFMTEIAELIAAAIADLGYETVFPAPGLPEARNGAVNLVVAPHEFFVLQPERSAADLLRAAEASVCVGVEQPGTYWYELTVHYASVGRSVLDISTYAVEEHRRRGLDARHLQLGYHPLWDRWGGDVKGRREVDVLFLGSMTERRARFLGDAAPLLWDCRCDLRLFEFPRPMSQPTGRFLAGAAKWDLLAHSRILLNVHRSEVPYFEWVRSLEAVCNGCLLVTEASADYGPLVAGEHLVGAPLETLGALAASVAIDEPLRREIVASAYDHVRTRLELTALLAPVCEDLAVAAPRPARDGRALPRPPHPHAAGPPQPALLGDIHATETRVRASVKELLDSETALIRSLEGLEAELRYGDASYAVVECTPAWHDFEANLTVLVTSYNYERYLPDALDSVVASEGVAAEVVGGDGHTG